MIFELRCIFFRHFIYFLLDMPYAMLHNMIRPFEYLRVRRDKFSLPGRTGRRVAGASVVRR